jgi:hypothetical protein
VLQLGDPRVASRWGALFRRAPSPEAENGEGAVHAYTSAALELLTRWEDLHQHWLVAVDEQRRNERLANAAAVYRWQLNAIGAQLEALTVPPAVATWHEALVKALGVASSGTRLLSHGYRFHNVRMICDGGLLLEEACERARVVRDAFRDAAGQQVGAG